MIMAVDIVVVVVVVWVVGDVFDADVVVEEVMDDNSARAHCLVDGGVCVDTVRVMGTEIRVRFQS